MIIVPATCESKQRIAAHKSSHSECQGEFVANYTQHETLSQVEEFHPGECDRVIGDLVVEPFQFNAPRLFGGHPDNFYNSLGFVIDFGRVKGHSQSPSHEEDQRVPEVEGVHLRWFLAEIIIIKSSDGIIVIN